MANAWGNSWGSTSAWGDSWGAAAVVVPPPSHAGPVFGVVRRKLPLPPHKKPSQVDQVPRRQAADSRRRDVEALAAWLLLDGE